MRVVVIDDWDNRHNWITSLFSQFDIQNVDITHFKCPNQVRDQDIWDADLVCLDHDMCVWEEAGDLKGGLIVSLECPNTDRAHGLNMLNPHCGCPTGRDTVEQIIRLGANTKVWVHTSNHIGGPVMVKRLTEAGFKAVWQPADETRSLTLLLEGLEVLWP
ncbi:MAG: hypothetical protein UY48_C0009G0013 [Candidatus Gottesmanbacteria bacterium GW2011_GWB1_49_7]|uniref:Uncharacterized protein n=1 Tax=Candidatus Gottesmanbacteria bacterium GW2011_GWB1_49_7 TaxID=1618448 RepID=A0A0G1W2I1_9BACT|nr:MAG: hypothetical protein UY48_C0009G0013 [Candidatus Gottesmanbacteria bacterium GW2011_GWB1_49_7]